MAGPARRVHGQLAAPGITVTPSTAWQVLKDAGDRSGDPAGRARHHRPRPVMERAYVPTGGWLHNLVPGMTPGAGISPDDKNVRASSATVAKQAAEDGVA
jgi:hypothetical protein